MSIIVPCYNAAEFLGDALQSIASQTSPDFECIVIDDASSDGSTSVAMQIADADPRFLLIALPSNVGAAAARNAGLAKAKGRWVGFLDADDLFLPDRLQRLVEVGDRSGAEMVVDDQLITAFPDCTPQHRAFGFTETECEFTQEDYFTRSRVFTRSLAAGYMKPLISRKLLDRTEARYDPAIPSGEDFVFYAQLFASRPRCIATGYAGYVYRRRQGSLSRSDTHLHVHAGLSDGILTRHGSRLSPQSRIALAARERDFEKLAVTIPALAALRDRQWRKLSASLLSSPTAIITGVRLLWRRVMRSLPSLRSRDSRLGRS